MFTRTMVKGKEKEMGVFGDKYLIRKTFDVLDYQGGVYGFDVFDENKQFLFHYDGEDEEGVVSEVKWKIYRSFL